MRDVVVLGSTGSIGTQALDIVAANPSLYRVVGLAAGGSDPALIAAQALATGAEVVSVHRSSALGDVQLALYAEAKKQGFSTGGWKMPRLLAGPQAATELAGTVACHTVLNGIAGTIGLAPTLAALQVGRTVALANKESLTCGGPLVMDLVGQDHKRLVPVDSEHSALAQCLLGARPGEVAALVLTASGGPFRGRTREQLGAVTVADALKHPTWTMGPLVTVNSATLANKGLELIEAQLLFGHLLPGKPYDAIDVVVHPQSLVHSMVTYVDGSTLAQVSPPDMRLPIALGLGWPARTARATPPMDWRTPVSMTFEPVDTYNFPMLDLAREAGRRGGLAPCAFTAANEEAVGEFLAGRLSYLDIADVVATVVGDTQNPSGTPTLDEVLGTEGWARARVQELVRGAV